MSIRTAIARWLAPELVETEDRYERLISQMQDSYWWIGEFPDAADTIRHLLDSHHNRWRAIGEPPRGKLPDDISGFREHLRRRAALSPSPAEAEALPDGVDAVAGLIDKLAKCRSENAMDEAFLDNPEEIAAAVIDKLLPTPSSKECDWPAGHFTIYDAPNEHQPCYVVMPGGAMIAFNHHAGKNEAGDFVDVARARFVVAACNAALSASAPAPEERT